MSDHIRKLIEQGEHQQLDFKFEISDSRKIARSLVAFANTNGGRLLVGVKDNGIVAGIRSDEEYYMVEAAAQMYCIPEVAFHTMEWEINGKQVLEVIVPKNTKIKHKAPTKDGEFKIFVRVNDKNILANAVLMQVWKKESSKLNVKVSFTSTEMLLLQYLSTHTFITENEFREMAQIKKRKADALLSDFILLGIIQMNLSEKETTFQLVDAHYLENVKQH